MESKIKYNCDYSKRGTIYKITFENKKCYIGQTIRPLNYRINQHISDAKKGVDTALYNAIRKYKTFSVDILFENKDLHKLNEQEQLFINEYKSLVTQNGYNIREGGNNTILAETTKIKISKSLKGKHNINRGKNISKALTGKKQPNISKALTGRKNPHIGVPKTENTKEKIKKAMKAKPIVICPHCNKAGKGSNMARYHFHNCKYITHLE